MQFSQPLKWGAWVVVGENGPFSRDSLALATLLRKALWLAARCSDPSVGSDRINFIKSCTKLYFCIALELKRLSDVFVLSV
ncbi:hypothetical protein OKW98_17285 [Pseudomonas sp. KU26590]|uniref:hypothetical protein n=1 Tax=Pseudomonas sp. KU26590 TaxID=2991051 RepID=UPI00223D81A4|nr:hypothetical protein [Pseudomonas sp. KU26590]UZJ58348.1 hypothetical protein OKW98_17285 [Pseudomonas sp. KU26590]